MNIIIIPNSLPSLVNTNDDVTGSVLLSVSCYDDFGRPTRVISDNHLGGKEVVYTNYNFTGQVTQTTTLHNHGQVNQVLLASTFEYDHQGRVTAEKLKINEADEVTLAAYKYNKLGEQVTRYLHGSSSGSNFNQQVDYSYNEKGWLRSQNSIADPGRDLFAQELRYSDSGSGYYNGNILQAGWLSSGSIAKNYTFTYDSLSRLKTAVYADGISDGHFNTGYSYDANGNLSALSRKADNVEIDALAYTYLSGGNRLKSVTESSRLQYENIKTGDTCKVLYARTNPEINELKLNDKERIILKE